MQINPRDIYAQNIFISIISSLVPAWNAFMDQEINSKSYSFRNKYWRRKISTIGKET